MEEKLLGMVFGILSQQFFISKDLIALGLRASWLMWIKIIFEKLITMQIIYRIAST